MIIMLINQSRENKGKIDISHTKELIHRYGKKKGILIPLLQDIQDIYGYVPHEAIELIAKELNVFPVQIYEVITICNYRTSKKLV